MAEIEIGVDTATEQCLDPAHTGPRASCGGKGGSVAGPAVQAADIWCESGFLALHHRVTRASSWKSLYAKQFKIAELLGHYVHYLLGDGPLGLSLHLTTPPKGLRAK